MTTIDLRDAGLGGKLSQTLGDFTAITKLDLSSNSISGELPDSMAKLSSLSTLHVQNNQLTGTLDVLRDLPLTDLNVENNQFSGPIPDKLLSVPKFLRNGNHFTEPPTPESSPTPATPPPPPVPPSHVPPPPAAPEEPPVLSGSHPPIYVIPAPPQDAPPSRHKDRVSPAKAAGFSILAAAAEEKIERTPRDYVKAAGSSFKSSSNGSIVSDKKNVQRSSEGPPVHLQLPFTLFTVASLQQYTNGFSDQDLMRETCFGKVYPADRPTGSKIVHGVAGLRHPNVEELVGCCVEHGQRLLVYKHFSDRTLDDMLRFEHGASEAGDTLRWDARIAVALEAAKALEYLHEGAGKQVVHRHFRPEHVLIDGELRVSVSGCGLAPFVLQLSDYCGVTLSYEPPEAAGGGGAAWTPKGDVYSFGVVMLQLLTGRKPYDSSRARGERHLVPWASARLYDLAALGKMADPRLAVPPPLVRSLSRFADIINRCIQQEAEFRPAMSQVAQDLRRALEDARAGTGTGCSCSARRWTCCVTSRMERSCTV
ncbi:unnamed protein product [Miscanthus lutarioriparius]|uniref:Protein kinase domain-containing protein n=1 Tax=Miscanthus lutarioriparius TaxID=422564 RepID=A0A811Q8V6_9POAL|nr:unnamed protein product [Miscanthus lutarioriparius]